MIYGNIFQILHDEHYLRFILASFFAVEIPGLIRKLRQCRFHMVQRKVHYSKKLLLFELMGVKNVPHREDKKRQVEMEAGSTLVIHL